MLLLILDFTADVRPNDERPTDERPTRLKRHPGSLKIYMIFFIQRPFFKQLTQGVAHHVLRIRYYMIEHKQLAICWLGAGTLDEYAFLTCLNLYLLR